MYLSLLGLCLDAFGAYLLLHGEIKSGATFLNYLATGEYQGRHWDRLRKLVWWKRLPLHIGSRLWSWHGMGEQGIEDNFPVKFWGALLLMLGFLLQAVAGLFPILGMMA